MPQARRAVGVARTRHPGQVQDVSANSTLPVVRAVCIFVANAFVVANDRGGLSPVFTRFHLFRVRRVFTLPATGRRSLHGFLFAFQFGLCQRRLRDEFLRDVPPAPRDAVREQFLPPRPFLRERLFQVTQQPLRGFRANQAVLRGDAKQLVVAKHGRFVKLPVPLHAEAREPEPIGGREVHRLGDVEPGVEPRVVRSGKGHDELACVLVRSVHRDVVLGQPRRGQHGDELEQQIRRRREQIGHGFFEALLERLRACARHAVPRLRRANVVVVHAVQSVVLEVPAEGGKGGAEVQPRDKHAGNVVTDAAQKRTVFAIARRRAVQRDPVGFVVVVVVVVVGGVHPASACACA